MQAAVVGHVEWIDFAAVPRLPVSGEILHAGEYWSEPAGGGGVAAAEMARLCGQSWLFTALSTDAYGQRARQGLEALGVRVHSVARPEAQARAFTLVEPLGERTILVYGPRLAPRGEEDLPWAELARMDAVYFCKGDAAALRAARQARVLVATARVLPLLREAGIQVDALVRSADDPGEAYADGDLTPAPRLVVATEGPRGGTWWDCDGRQGRYPAVPLPGTARDAYGCGDSFAAALAVGLARGPDLAAALRLAASSGAAALCRVGAHGRGQP
jgi:ribokinase